jgi:tRNA pseudouridine55 synthase
LLPLCFGEATKFAAGLLDADKDYEAVVQLGSTTSTGDAEGEVTFRGEPIGVVERIGEILHGLRGAPTADSADVQCPQTSRAGRLYEYARSGQMIERASRQVMIHELTLLRASSDELELRVQVSKGTYIRTLAEAIGERPWLRCAPEGAPTYPGGLFQSGPSGPVRPTRGVDG